MARSRKDAWLKDESLLALDLYVRYGVPVPVSERRALSELLRAMPVERHLAQSPRFRNLNGVTSKVYNHQYLDTGSEGRSNYGQADRKVFEEWSGRPEELRARAEAIRANWSEYAAVEDPEPEEEFGEEGRVLTVTHRRRERDPRLAAKKRARALATTGTLACEACGFDSGRLLGEDRAGLVECHHVVPVEDLRPGNRTRLADLALLCPTCHSLVHQHRPWLTMEQLSEAVAPLRRRYERGASQHATAPRPDRDR